MMKRTFLKITCVIFMILAGVFQGYAQKASKKSPAQSFEMVEVKALPYLQEKNKTEFQPLLLKIKLTGDSCKATAFVEGNDPFPFNLKNGDNVVEIPVKAVSTEKKVTIRVESKGMAAAQKEVLVHPVKKLTCYILPHSHTDIGYTEIQTAIEEKQVQNLVKGMELAKKTAAYPEGARFIWNVEVAWAADLYLNRMNDAQRNDFMNAVKTGQVALNGMYLNLLTGLCRPEELSQLFKFSTELSKKCNVSINAAMTSDVPGQTWGTVTAMSQAGIKYFSTAPNFFDRIGNILVEWENKPFYWVSPSGNEKVLVWIPLKGYALSHLIKKLSPEFVSSYSHQLDSMQYPYDIAYLRWSGHGDNAEPDPEISEFIKNWSSKYTWPKFIISSTSEAFEAFENKYGQQLPFIKGDWTPYWEDGAGSSAVETAMNRASSDRLSQAEALWAMKDPSTYPAGDLEAAWKKVLLYSEHTWGAWCSVSDPENKMTKEQWEIKQSYAREADKLSRELLEKALGLNESAMSPKLIEVINTNAWERSDVAIIPASLSSEGDKVTGPDGKPVASQRLSNGDLAILVKSIPGYSSRSYQLKKGKAFGENLFNIQNNTIGNGLVTVKIDPKTGAIAELNTSTDKTRNFSNSTSGYGLNDYAFLDADKINDIQRTSNVQIKVKENGPLIASLLIESDAPACNKLTREIRLTAGSSVVEMVNTVDKKRAKISEKPGDWTFAQHGGKESVNFAFPFNVQNGDIHMDVSYGLVQPEEDQIASACKNWLTLNRWVDVSNKETGIALISMDAPLIEVGGITATMLGSQTNPGVWRKHIEPTQTIFSWAINNHWGTNYRAYQEGLITFRYALMPHQQFQPAEISKYAIGLSQPLLVKKGSETKTVYQQIIPNKAGVIVTAFKPTDDGKGKLITLFNSSGETLKTDLLSNSKEKSHIWNSNSAEEKLQEVTAVELPAWGTTILRFE